MWNNFSLLLRMFKKCDLILYKSYFVHLPKKDIIA